MSAANRRYLPSLKPQTTADQCLHTLELAIRITILLHIPLQAIVDILPTILARRAGGNACVDPNDTI